MIELYAYLFFLFIRICYYIFLLTETHQGTLLARTTMAQHAGMAYIWVGLPRLAWISRWKWTYEVME